VGRGPGDPPDAHRHVRRAGLIAMGNGGTGDTDALIDELVDAMADAELAAAEDIGDPPDIEENQRMRERARAYLREKLKRPPKE